MEDGNEHSIAPVRQLSMGLLLESDYLLANTVNCGVYHTVDYLETVLQERRFFWFDHKELSMEALFNHVVANGSSYCGSFYPT